MTKARAAIIAYMMQHVSDDHEVVTRTLNRIAVLNPLFDQAERGRPLLQSRDTLDWEDYSDALAVFLDKKGKSLFVQFASAAAGDVPTHSSEYRAFLVNMLAKESSVVLGRFGDGVVEEFQELYWRNIGMRLFSFLTQTYQETMGHWDQRLVTLACEGYTALPADYLLAVMSGNEERVVRLAPLLRQMAQAVPIGVLKDKASTWIVLCS